MSKGVAGSVEILFKVTGPNYQGTAADNWSQRCQESTRNQTKEIESRYGIRIGMTEIYCARCGKSWGLGKHICQDVVFQRLQEEKKEKREIVESQIECLLDRLKKVGAKKFSTLSFKKKDEEESFIPEKVINNWIYRGNIPPKYIERIDKILNSVQG